MTPRGDERSDQLAQLLELRSQVSQALEHLLGKATPCGVALGLGGVVGQLHHVVAELQALAEDLGDRIAAASGERLR
jgi:hypothetical protein